MSLRLNRWQGVFVTLTLLLVLFSVRLGFPLQARACGSYGLDHINSSYATVYDYGQQRYTNLNFYLYSYADGCSDYEWLTKITVTDGSPATFTAWTSWYYPGNNQCGTWQSDGWSYNYYHWSPQVNEYSPALPGNCGSHNADTHNSAVDSGSFSPSHTVATTVYS